jgi:hypothetical protein
VQYTKYAEPHGLPEEKTVLNGCLAMKSLHNTLRKAIGEAYRLSTTEIAVYGL